MTDGEGLGAGGARGGGPELFVEESKPRRARRRTVELLCIERAVCHIRRSRVLGCGGRGGWGGGGVGASQGGGSGMLLRLHLFVSITVYAQRQTHKDRKRAGERGKESLVAVTSTSEARW